MAEWHATPSLQTVIPNCYVNLGIWNHLSVIRDLGLQTVILLANCFEKPDICLSCCQNAEWVAWGCILHLGNFLKKVKRTSFLNLQSFNNAREFVMHPGKKKMPLLLPGKSKVNVIWFIWRSNIEWSIAPHNDYPYFSFIQLYKFLFPKFWSMCSQFFPFIQ